MLSFDVFTSEFVEFLCPHFNKELKSSREAAAYYEAFQGYSDATFTSLCNLAFRECRFLPEPQWFVERAADLALQALAEADRRVALPSAQMRELDAMSEEQQSANLKRLRAMLKATPMQSLSRI